MQLQLWSYQDLIDAATDYCGAATDATTERFARRAVQDAMNGIWNDRNWVYFYQRGRINTVASYGTGTVVYDATGGASERLLTLTSGAFPAWTSEGTLVLNNIPYDIFARLSSTTAQLAVNTDPGIDIASATYSLFKDTYVLPVDFGAMGEIINVGNARIMTYVTPDEFIKMQRMQVTAAAPYAYSITGDPRRYGAMVVRFYPAPDSVYAMDFIYRRSPRQLNVIGYDTGTVATTASSTTVTGTGTAWTSGMVGAMFRVSVDTVKPTGPSGANPCALERVVAGVSSATSLTLDAAAASSVSGVSHCISDPVDVEPGAMLNYLLRSVEKSMRSIRRMKATPDEEQTYAKAFIKACEADARHYENRSTYSSSLFPIRYSQMPVGPDVT